MLHKDVYMKIMLQLLLRPYVDKKANPINEQISIIPKQKKNPLTDKLIQKSKSSMFHCFAIASLSINPAQLFV